MHCLVEPRKVLALILSKRFKAITQALLCRTVDELSEIHALVCRTVGTFLMALFAVVMLDLVSE